jgi:hypothetical protein
MPTPIALTDPDPVLTALTDDQLSAVMRAAAPLDPQNRDVFLRELPNHFPLSAPALQAGGWLPKA